MNNQITIFFTIFWKSLNRENHVSKYQTTIVVYLIYLRNAEIAGASALTTFITSFAG